MKKLVVFYSYTGHTKKEAKRYAKKENADICEVKDKKRPGVIKAYTLGCFAAMKGKRTEIEPIAKDMKNYDRIIILAPVWAGKPAPAINGIFGTLPSGKEVEVIMVSASGNSRAKEKVEGIVKRRGCSLVKYEDVKG